jgi:hypothetical protein
VIPAHVAERPRPGGCVDEREGLHPAAPRVASAARKRRVSSLPIVSPRLISTGGVLTPGAGRGRSRG